ncbi:hypothetical protein [Clostridium sp. E02]|uniref:hypothetical protein n=1 Tax=Clostridium sp. E02 TaxID=2487134 RepID=UPI000F54AA3B|nr:hypothetical protein [Clostridium sp. E02]
MTVKKLMESDLFETVNIGDASETITQPFCCDLLSIAMGKAPKGCAWVTVMGNMNTLAVASLTEAACVILAEGVLLDEQGVKKAKEQGISVLKTALPIYQAARMVETWLEQNEASL